MTQMQPLRPYLIEGLGQADAAVVGKDREQAVLNAYTAALRQSFRSEKDAFDAAVGAYLARYPDVSVTMARQAVANIICHKP